MNKPTPTRAALTAKPITPVMAEYVAWLEAETGYKVDPMSVQLSGILRPTFQKSAGNQKRLAETAARVAAEKVARAERAAARAAKPVAEPKVAKVSTPKPKAAPKPVAKNVPAKPAQRRRPVKVEATA